MEIRLHLDELSPPTGLVTLGDNPTLAFAGWLELLALLSDAVDHPRPGGRARPGKDGEGGNRPAGLNPV